MKRVPDEEFVRAWLSSSSAAEVASKVGGTAHQASVRAYHMRVLGVELPRIKNRGRHGTINVAALNALISEVKP